MSEAEAPCYDIFNGDADGICALHQLRLAEPCEARLITGVKRDIRLLDRLLDAVEAGARLTVLDISLDSNRESLVRLLESCTVFYVDHHYAGTLPVSPRLTAHIDPDPETCTSLLVDRLLAGRYRAWAVVAAFGDNLHAAAGKAAATLGLAASRTQQLRELGELINYNSYGRDESDLHLPPASLYRALTPYTDPLVFCAEAEALGRLRQGFADDLRRARAVLPERENGRGRIYRFPAEQWARRVAGVFANERARENPEQAQALLVENGDGTVQASVRAPIKRRRGADSLCAAFPTGGGRAGAAGINALPMDRIEDFYHAFLKEFAG